MSFFLANFNNTDPTHPSFFEMVAQREMMSTLTPALKWAFAVRFQLDRCYFNQYLWTSFQMYF